LEKVQPPLDVKMKRTANKMFWRIVLCLALPGVIYAQSASAPLPYPSYVTPDTSQGTGPYPAVMEVDPSLPTHTVYRPADLAALGKEKLPVVAWGNGACINAGNRFRFFLTEIASHGFLVVAIGPIGPASIEYRPARPRPSTGVHISPPVEPPDVAAAMTQHVTHPKQLLEVLDWAKVENERPASPFYHRLNTAKFAVMGQSCGGEQAIEASADPRVTTSVAWNSGIKAEATDTPGGKMLTKQDLQLVHAPIAFIGGDASDIAFIDQNDSFARLTKVPAFRAYEDGVTHGGTYGEPNGGAFAKVGVAWLQWQLEGNKQAAKMFIGKDCGLCMKSGWHVMKKNIP
jgi:hypothetical protein